MVCFLKMTCRNPKCSEEIVCVCRFSSAGLHQNRVCLCVWFELIRMPISSLSLWRGIVLVLVVWLRRSGRQAVRVGESERHAGQKQTETLQDRQSVSSSSDTVPLKHHTMMLQYSCEETREVHRLQYWFFTTWVLSLHTSQWSRWSCSRCVWCN